MSALWHDDFSSPDAFGAQKQGGLFRETFLGFTKGGDYLEEGIIRVGEVFEAAANTFSCSAYLCLRALGGCLRTPVGRAWVSFQSGRTAQ